MEILLVVVIIGIMSGVAVPMFAKSVQGARLRQSSRMVLSMHRQAKAKAVLGQQYAALFFDDQAGTVEMFSQQDGARKDVFFDDLGRTAGGSGASLAGDPASGEGGGVAPVSLGVRKLEEGVEIEAFEGGGDVDGIHYVQYYPNGMCEEWSLTLRDKDGRSIGIAVNPVTGVAKVDE